MYLINIIFHQANNANMDEHLRARFFFFLICLVSIKPVLLHFLQAIEQDKFNLTMMDKKVEFNFGSKSHFSSTSIYTQITVYAQIVQKLLVCHLRFYCGSE